MRCEFSGELWHWVGPAPWYFVTVPEEQCQALRELSPLLTYGWGMIPVRVQLGTTRFTTSLFPKDGGYIVPVKASVRKAEQLEAGAAVSLRLDVT